MLQIIRDYLTEWTTTEEEVDYVHGREILCNRALTKMRAQAAKELAKDEIFL